MDAASLQNGPLQELLIALTDGEMNAVQFAELQQLLRSDPAAQSYYRRYMRLCALLEFEHAAGAEETPKVASRSGSGTSTLPLDSISHAVQPAVSFSSRRDELLELEFGVPPARPLPKIEIDTTPKVIPWYSLHSPIGLPVIGYSTGAILTLLLVGVLAVIHVTHRYEIAARPAASSEDASGGGISGPSTAAEKPKPEKEPVYIGRITGMVGCRWAEPRSAPTSTRITQGTKIALAAGLLDITYQAGARIILQGPCTFEAESPNGCYLALGKLTARVESKVEGGERNSLQIPESPISNPFTVRTPTALITDLGTEFGVEVNEDAWTTSHVFQGRVLITVLGLEGQEKTITLNEDESAVVNGEEVEVRRQNEAAASFCRALPPNPFPFVAYLHEGKLIFSESFDRDSQHPEVDYPEFRFLSSEVSRGAGKSVAVVADGFLRLSREGGGKGRSWDIAETVRRFTGPIIVAVDLGADPSWIGDVSVGLRLDELLLVFHPGIARWRGKEVRGLFRVEKRRPEEKQGVVILPNTEIGFVSYVDVLHHLFLYYDGQEAFHVCLIDGVNPHKIFRTSFTDPCLLGRDFSIGLQRWGRPNRGMFDNLCVYQLPQRKAEAISGKRPSSHNTPVEEVSTMNGP